MIFGLFSGVGSEAGTDPAGGSPAEACFFSTRIGGLHERARTIGTSSSASRSRIGFSILRIDIKQMTQTSDSPQTNSRCAAIQSRSH